MTNDKQYPVSDDAKQRAHLSIDQYQDLYQKSINAPETFWPEMANEFLTWSKPWEQLTESNLMTGTAGWFIGGKLNACYNCVDRHLPERAQQTAILWEGDDPSQQATITYQDLHQRVCQLANLLIQRGVKKGDRVCLYMPMIPEAAYAMLACARIGAVHSVVFGGFSPQALQDRILDSDCQTVITADEGVRGGKTVPLKVNADLALEQCPNVHSVIVVRHTGGFVSMQPERDLWYNDETILQPPSCPAEPMDSEDPLFILYTSGSTGKPKGVLHTTGGYLLQAAMTHRYVFDYHDGDIYWCTADVGWVTGHTYIVYGPLANGATTLMFEGIPNYPDASRCWQIVDKHQVNIFYTAPTALRALMGMGNEFVQATNRSSLRILGSVGEPINPEAWEWYYHIVGDGR
ncbi:MAG: AMP-binding protein, partial [Gammaproteobacteria bacterium]|nr:AMP-binding protein [Gammaproteobacteria bacterium]